MTPPDFYCRVLFYCTLARASITSSFRTAHHNEQVGGVPHSAHLVGLAADVVYDGTPPEKERREWAERLGLKLIVEGDHDHLQPPDWRAG